ncbi:MAG: hypothetical protein DRH57_06515 [Candidatus Cloacimonadota bacterium]|nr:MAG: hypothetical protein DRH57_06515 [Candidatus Cloacimonadota bacterium]
MNIQTRPLNDITKEAILVLNKAIGITNTLRFLNQFTIGYGDYTKEKEKLFEDLNLEDIISEIKQIIS